MTQEWQPISTAPKNQVVCLITASYHEFSGYKRGDDKWVTESNEHYLNKDFIMWHPFPEPPKILHECSKLGYICKTKDDKSMVFISSCGPRIKIEHVEVNFCPFCGLKADKEEK